MKEEIVGMLAAVEMWVNRDHEAEDRIWTSWMANIGARVSTLGGLEAVVRQPRGPDNDSPGLWITWAAAKYGVTGPEMAALLDSTEPRIVLSAGSGSGFGAQTGISITAHMMSPDDDKIVGDRIYEVLSTLQRTKGPEKLNTPTGDLRGRWDVHIDFAAVSGDHEFEVRQEGNQPMGTHQGEFISRDFASTISGDQVRIASNVGENHGAAMSYRFRGKLDGDTMSGTLDLGEYLGARWTAKRHAFGDWPRG